MSAKHSKRLRSQQQPSRCTLPRLLQDVQGKTKAHDSVVRDQQKRNTEKGRWEQRCSIAHACSGCTSSLRPLTGRGLIYYSLKVSCLSVVGTRAPNGACLQRMYPLLFVIDFLHDLSAALAHREGQVDLPHRLEIFFMTAQKHNRHIVHIVRPFLT